MSSGGAVLQAGGGGEDGGERVGVLEVDSVESTAPPASPVAFEADVVGCWAPPGGVGRCMSVFLDGGCVPSLECYACEIARRTGGDPMEAWLWIAPFGFVSNVGLLCLLFYDSLFPSSDDFPAFAAIIAAMLFAEFARVYGRYRLVAATLAYLHKPKPPVSALWNLSSRFHLCFRCQALNELDLTERRRGEGRSGGDRERGRGDVRERSREEATLPLPSPLPPSATTHSPHNTAIALPRGDGEKADEEEINFEL